MDKYRVAMFLGFAVVMAVLVGGLVTLRLSLSSSSAENAQLNQNLIITDATVASLQSEVTALQQEVHQNREENATLRTQNTQLKQDPGQKDTALAKAKGDPEATNEFQKVTTYIAIKALSGLSALIPEGGTLVVRNPGFDIGDTTFTNKGYPGGFEIEIFKPGVYGIKPNTPRGTTNWTWGIFAGTQVEMIPSLLR